MTARKKPASQSDAEDWPAERVKYEIRIRATSLRAFGKTHGYSRNAISMALSRPWPALERKIAQLIGVEPWEIWPSRYSADHEPRVRLYRKKVA